MDKPVVLVVGLGEVGRSLYDLLKQSKKFDLYCYDVDKTKMQDITQGEIPTKLDVMYICYPCGSQENFINLTVDYMNKFISDLTIINSTAPPGTTKKVHEITGGNLVHSPIRGMHSSLETMKRDLLFWTKFIGGINQKSAELAQKHFEELGLKTKLLSGPTETELAKLFSTTYRAWMIACFQEMHRISRNFEADFSQIIEFLQDTHSVRFDRPLHFPGVIGGHCLIPNTELLSKIYDSEFLKLILSSNEKRKTEMANPKIAHEVEKIQEKVKSLEEKTIKMQ
jgi:UDP-N-acetyl-D-mannosaminuronate dehydrogenase